MGDGHNYILNHDSLFFKYFQIYRMAYLKTNTGAKVVLFFLFVYGYLPFFVRWIPARNDKKAHLFKFNSVDALNIFYFRQK